jgi:feruloyl-CoA synthase
MSDVDVLRSPGLRGRLQAMLDSFAAESTGTSSCVVRAILLEEPPSMEANELTDKGSLNARAVLAHRAALVEELYAAEPSPRVIAVDLARQANVA